MRPAVGSAKCCSSDQPAGRPPSHHTFAAVASASVSHATAPLASVSELLDDLVLESVGPKANCSIRPTY